MSISPGTVIVLIFAVLFGLVGAYTVREHLREPAAAVVQAAPEPEPVKLTYVPMASNDLPAHRPLTLSDIVIYKFTPKQLANKSDLPAEFMSNPEQIVGRVLKTPLTKGTTFQADHFFPEGMMLSVAERLAPGLRAVTIPVQGTGALEGQVDSSSHVDVVFRTALDNDQPQRTVTLVEDVEVLAVDRNTVPGAVNSTLSGTVTLAVNVSQAHSLKVAEGRGEFSLTLRSTHAADQPVSTGAWAAPETLESLLKLPRTRYQAEIYRGASREDVEFKVDPRDQTWRGGAIRSTVAVPAAPANPVRPADASTPADVSTTAGHSTQPTSTVN